MPGHKRNVKSGDSPYAYDITEIDGFDNLHHPRGILRASMDMATTSNRKLPKRHAYEVGTYARQLQRQSPS